MLTAYESAVLRRTSKRLLQSYIEALELTVQEADVPQEYHERLRDCKEELARRVRTNKGDKA